MSRRKLSRQQIQRVAQIQARRRADFAEQDASNPSYEADSETTCAEAGRVVTRYGASLAVIDDDGRIHLCLTRQNIGHPVCGDRVVWQPTRPGHGVVTALQPRHSVLSRPDYSGRNKPLAANITCLVVVLAPNPEPTEYLIDQYLVTAEHMGIEALIALNKMDLLPTDAGQAFLDRFAVYARIGYPLIPLSAHRERGIDPLLTTLHNHTAILVGQSGVGKSSLIHALLPDLAIQVGRLSEATGLGRHTTSAATWYQLPTDGGLIDSPGVRSFRLGSLQRRELEQGFREFRPYLERCRFGDCRHDQEPDCAIKDAVERKLITPERLASFRYLVGQ